MSNFALTADEQKARSELLEADHALAFEAASEQDHHGAGGDAAAELGCLVATLARRDGFLDIIRGVPARLLLGHGGHGGDLGSDLLAVEVALVLGAARRAAQAVDAGHELRVPGNANHSLREYHNLHEHMFAVAIIVIT